MKDKEEYEKVVIYISKDLNEQIKKYSEKNKMSLGSIFRSALSSYIDRK